MSPLRPEFGAARRGSVIVVVLVTLLLTSLMLMKFMESSAVELTLATRQADRDRLRADAYGALETLLAVMAEVKAIDENLYAPEQGWGDPYAYAGEAPREGVTVTYAFADESGKASLPKMSFDEMVELAQALGLGDLDARRFADGLYTWMKADHVPKEMDAEAIRYESDDPPINVPKRSLRSWDELRAVKLARDYVYDPETGALTPFGQALRDNISLYEFENSNVNALAPALGTARGWDGTQTAQIAGYRAGEAARPAGAPTWFRDIKDLGPLIGANADTAGLDATVKLLRVTVSVREGIASMSLSTLVAVEDGVELPAAAAPAEQGTNAAGGQGNANGGNSGGRRGQGNSGGGMPGIAAGGGGSGSGGSAQTEEKLDYPFPILEVFETAGPPPVVLPEEVVEEDPTL
jgi:hypothetical protein